MVFEIKASETVHNDFLNGLKNFQKVALRAESKLVYACQILHQQDNSQVSNLWNL